LRWAGLADFAPTSGTVVSAAVGSTAPGSTLAAPRGQLKSSARPRRAVIGSPLVIERVTVVSVGGATTTPSNSSAATCVPVSGTTGPAAGRSAGALGLAFGTCGAGSTGIGNATG